MLHAQRPFPPKYTSQSLAEKGQATTLETVLREQDIEAGKAESIQRPQRAPSKSNTVATWAVTICVLCTIVNCLIAFNLPNFGPPSLLEPIFSITREQFRLLRQSALIHGFAGPVLEETSNELRYPQELLISVDQGIYSSNGVLSINRTASTIAVFGAVDFGVEHCEVGFRLTPTESINASITSATELPFSISIYQLERYYPLEKQTSSHSVFPRRLSNVGNITVVPGLPVHWSQSINCATKEILAFEVGCSENEVVTGCSIEWWQKRNEQDPLNVVFMVQYPL